ncbi:MAG: hypothetical protein ACJ8EY_05640 [Sphingomicrobium sp.]
MTPQIAAIMAIGFVVPIVAGLWFPRWLLMVFVPVWTAGPPLALTFYYADLEGWGRNYPDLEALLGVLMFFMFILIWPWMTWSAPVFRLLRERREGVRHEPPHFLS